MNLKTTIILLIIALSLGAYIFVYELKTTEEFEVNRLSITKESGEEIVVEKQADSWQITKPINMPADSFKVENFIMRLTNLQALRVITDYKIDKVRLEIKLDGEGPAQGLNLGEETLYGNNIYAQFSGEEEVMILPGAIFDELNIDVSYLRYRRVFDFDISEVEKITLKAEGVDKEVLADENSEEFSILLAKLISLDALEFVNDNPAELGAFSLIKPKAEIILHFKSSKRQGLLIGAKLQIEGRNELYAKTINNEGVFTVPLEVLSWIDGAEAGI